MKILLINGSPHPHGCTFTALAEIANALKQDGVQSEIFWLGKNPISGCMGCGHCKKEHQCIINDVVNQFLEQAANADGFVFGSPVHFASASGALTSFMDRAFYANAAVFYYKPAAAVVSCRRGGAASCFDQLNKYFTIRHMPIVSSQYWNMVHGNTPEEVKQDLEGLQTMRTLAHNMAWLLFSIEAGKKAGISLPKQETAIHTNFIKS